MSLWSLNETKKYTDKQVENVNNLITKITDPTVEDIMQIEKYKYTSYYINATGNLTASLSWITYKIPITYSEVVLRGYTNVVGVYAVAFYSSDTPSDDTFLGGLKFTQIGLNEIAYKQEDVPPGTKCILLLSRTASGSETSMTGTYTINKTIYETKQSVKMIEAEIKGKGNIKAIYKSIKNSNDFTIIKDEIWFAQHIIDGEEHTDIRRYKIFDGKLKFISTITTDFGHLNCVDYNEDNDCLIFGNGSNSFDTDGNFFAVIKDPLSLGSVASIANDTIVYPVDIGYKVQAIWGDNNLGNNNIAYLISNNAGNIYKVLLIKDENGDFDGEYIVLESKETGFDYGVGGADFWGDTLYLGIGVRYQLAKISMTDYSVQEKEKKYYYEDGTQYSGSTQGVHVDSNHIWIFVNVTGTLENYLIQYYR